MALKDAPELQQYILKNVQPTGNILGSGSFGTVEQMQFNHALCAGKKIHQILVDPSSIGSKRLAEKFEQECKLMKELRHPNVVQFMGLCFVEDCNLPVIVMELLDNNIDSWISSNAQHGLPLSLKSIILHDTAKGLAYLHNHDPVVIHRDLTARNVLLTSSMRAKIADLGNAYIAPPQHLTKTMTRVPGTIAYMPPEAFEHIGRYTVKLDVFSFGHLALYVMTQEEPYLHLKPATYPDPNNEDKAIGLTEIERRNHYFDILSKQFASSHELTTLIRSCLNNNPMKRPSADQIVKGFDELLEDHKDEYQPFAKLNKFDMAKKVNEAQYSRLLRTVSFEDKIRSGEHFIFDFLKLKQGKKTKGGRNWKRYSFCIQSHTLKCYGDLNKDPVNTADLSKIERIVKSTEEENAFEIHLKKERWIIKTSSENESVAWVKVLQPKQQESYYDLPAAPSPPPEDPSDCNLYESVPGFEPKAAKQHGKDEYMPLDPSSLDISRTYAVSQVSLRPKKPDAPRRLKEAYGSDMKPQVPQIKVEEDTDTDACQVEAAATPGSAELPRSRSQLFSEEEMELLAKMLENVPLEDAAKIDLEDLGFRIRSSSFYDRIEKPPKSDTPQKEKDDTEVWPQTDGNYVDLDAIDDTYEKIPDQSPHYYFNIDDKPPVPPKVPPKSPRHGSVKRKPEPPPRKFNRLSVTKKNTSRARSLDKLMSASSSVSADMLVLGSNPDDDDEDMYEQVEHRPEWAKAIVSVPSDKEALGPDDDMLNLLSLDKRQIQNPKEFASGQFGAVYKATFHTSYGESVPVAIKTIKHETDAEKEAFLKEMKVMSKMLHPNIVRLFGLVIENNWIVLEYLSHGDLGNFLKKNHRQVRKLIKFMTDIAMGMHHISSLGLIHRDLAIRNVLVSQDEVCKVADFGLIRSMDDGQYNYSGTTKVPMRWCAPETFVKRVYYSASDVWSYGIVLWEMSNPTKLPYYEFQDYEVGVQIRDGRHPDIPQEYPKTVQDIMLACFNVKPEKRPSFQYISILLSKERYML